MLAVAARMHMCKPPQPEQLPTWMGPLSSLRPRKASLPMTRRAMMRPATATSTSGSSSPGARPACRSWGRADGDGGG